jgi:hypothetical protein
LSEMPPSRIVEAHLDRENDWQSAGAKRREAALQRATSAIVTEAEETLVASARQGLDRVKAVMASPTVSDILTLNLDTTVERMLAGWSDPGTVGQRTRKRHETLPWTPSSTRVWHIHGDRRQPRTIKLGIRHYGNMVGTVERARMDFKRREREHHALNKEMPTTESWVEVLMRSRLIVVGASLSTSEWDLWKILVDRHRNFAKRANRPFQPLAWIVTVEDSHREIPKDFVRHLSAPTWDKAWSSLAEILA